MDMYRHLISPWNSRIWKKRLFLQTRCKGILNVTVATSMILSGLLESVLALMICLAVCYLLTSDYLIYQKYIHKGCIGLLCPCILFGKNAEQLGSGTLAISCMTHFILWGLVSTLCCFLTDGVLLGVSGSVVACYACGQRRALRSKYNLQEAPCRDLTTHLFCHLCALCQEYREIQERAGNSSPSYFVPPVVTAPPVQVMKSPDRVESSETNTV